MSTIAATKDIAVNARERFVPWADELGRSFADHAAGHDRDGTFVIEAFRELRSSGYLALAVPCELGGRGATIAQVAMAQAALARHCGATALASSMHQHVVATNAHRWRHGVAAAEPMLRRIAADGIVVVSTGGTDGPAPAAPHAESMADGASPVARRSRARRRWATSCPPGSRPTKPVDG